MLASNANPHPLVGSVTGPHVRDAFLDPHQPAEACLTNDEFERLTKSVGEKLLGIAHNILLNLHDAKDAVQEALFALSKKPRGRFTDSIEVWLYQTVRNRAIDALRKATLPDPTDPEKRRRGPRRTVTLDDPDSPIPDLEVQPEEALQLTDELTARLHRCLADPEWSEVGIFTPARLSVLRLLIDGLSPEAITHRLGKSEDYVGKTKSDLRPFLKPQLTLEDHEFLRLRSQTPPLTDEAICQRLSWIKAPKLGREPKNPSTVIAKRAKEIALKQRCASIIARY